MCRAHTRQDDWVGRPAAHPTVGHATPVNVWRTVTGFPPDMFPVLLAVPRVAGWLAHWVELLDDPETRIYRPRQVRAPCVDPSRARSLG